MAKERKRLINEDMVQDQPTTIPARVGQSNRTPGRDNMGQEEVTANLMSDACITFPFFKYCALIRFLSQVAGASGVKRVTAEVNAARPDLLG